MTVIINGTSGITDVNGTAAAPAITGTDTDTGVFFGTNTVSLSTGGTERLQVDSSGNLGLGVTPSAWSSATLQTASDSGYGPFGYTRNAYYDGSNFKYISSTAASRYAQSGGAHLWFSGASGTAGNAITFTQAMTLDASGNLGIGTSSPSTRLHAKGTGGTIATFERDASGTIAYFNRNVGSGNAGAIIGADSVAGYFAGGNSTNNMVYLDSVNNLAQFYTNGSERARIDSSGNLLVGTTSNTKHTLRKDNNNNEATQFENSNASNPYVSLFYMSGASPNNTTNYFWTCVDNSFINRAILRSNGGLANYSANNVNLSDRREKTNFAPAGDYLAKICAIPVQTFNYIDQNLEEDDGLTLGVVAQDVQAVAPELVTETNWGSPEEPKMRLSVYQTDLQYALMKSIQELKAIVDAQASEIAALKGQA